MMPFNKTEKTMAAMAGAVLLGVLFAAPAAPASDQPPGRMIVPQERQTSAPPEGAATGSETTTGELSKATEQPMNAPAGDEAVALKPLLTPTVEDYERALESDALSGMAF